MWFIATVDNQTIFGVLIKSTLHDLKGDPIVGLWIFDITARYRKSRKFRHLKKLRTLRSIFCSIFSALYEYRIHFSRKSLNPIEKLDERREIFKNQWKMHWWCSNFVVWSNRTAKLSDKGKIKALEMMVSFLEVDGNRILCKNDGIVRISHPNITKP